MGWSAATERLRERYYALYGFSQGIWVSAVVVWVATGLAPRAPRAGCVGLFVVGVVASAVWRWSWRKYRAAFRAETDKAVAEAAEAARRLSELLHQQVRH